MAMSVNELFIQKFNEIQSRLPVKMNTPSSSSNSFQEILDKVSTTSSTSSTSTLSNEPKSVQIESAIASASSKYNVDPDLIRAIIKAESGFNPTAVSSVGAQGLMQLMPSTARGLGVTNSFDINQNVNGGTQYIKGKLDQFGGDVKLALAAYNAGPGAVIKYKGIPPYAETQNYVKTVLNYYNQYKNQ